jgi:hypothetical protein
MAAPHPISISGGAIMPIATTRPFDARVTNAHSAKCSRRAHRRGRVRLHRRDGKPAVIFDAATGQQLASDELRSAHGTMWDDARGVLWALGGDVLRAYTVGPAAGPTTLERTFELALPDGGGHDLTAIPGSARLFLSTLKRCWYFDRDRRQVFPHDAIGDLANIKSYAVHPRTGRVVYIQAEGQDWWAEHLHFQHPDGTLRLPGEHLYKARWV